MCDCTGWQGRESAQPFSASFRHIDGWLLVPALSQSSCIDCHLTNLRRVFYVWVFFPFDPGFLFWGKVLVVALCKCMGGCVSLCIDMMEDTVDHMALQACFLNIWPVLSTYLIKFS